MLPGTSERSQRHTFLHVSFSNGFGLASVHPLSTGVVGCAEKHKIFLFIVLRSNNRNGGDDGVWRRRGARVKGLAATAQSEVPYRDRRRG